LTWLNRQNDKEIEPSTCRQRVQNCLNQIHSCSDLNAFRCVFEDALERAEEIDQKITQGTAGKLAGMVTAIKDNIVMVNSVSTAGSRILQNYSSPYEATVVTRMLNEDAVIIGKTNMDEFGMGSSTENSAYGPVKNSVHPDYIPGGSSGGSAVAVAADMADTALGSDTGGSVRQPAALTGVVGLRPTYGTVSRYGLIAFASSLDQIGCLSKNVPDAAILLQVIAGYDDRDSTSASLPVPDYSSELERDVKGLRIGIPDEYFGEGLDDEVHQMVQKAIDRFKEEGASVQRVKLPHTDYGIATYYLLCTAEASSNLARYDGVRYGLRKGGKDGLREMYEKTRSEGFGDEVKRRIMLGTYVLSAGYYDAYYRKAQKVRTLIRSDYEKAFSKCDVIAGPATPTTAFKLGEKINDPMSMYLSDIYTVSGPLAGVPAISIPVGKDAKGLPIGIQLTGKAFQESELLGTAHWLEKAVN